MHDADDAIPETQIFTYKYFLDESGERKLTLESPVGFPDAFSHDQPAKLIVRDVDGTVLDERVGLIDRPPKRTELRHRSPEELQKGRMRFRRLREDHPQAYAKLMRWGVNPDFVDGGPFLNPELRRNTR